MAILFMEGFDKYVAAANVLARGGWDYSLNNVNSLQTGRLTGQCFRLAVPSGGTALQKKLTATSTLICGCAYRTSNFGANCFVFAFRDGQSTIQVGMFLDTTGHVKVYRGTTANILGTGTTALSLNTFYYIEMLVTFHGSAGVVQVHIDGNTELNLSALNTSASGSTTANWFEISGGIGNSDHDDLYVADTTGSAPQNTFLGPCQIEWKSPNADTAQKDLTPDTGTANFSRVNETLSDTTNYVSSNAVGKDLYTISPLAATPFIYAVKTSALAQKMDAAARVIRGNTKNGSTTTNGASRSILTDPVYLDDIYNQNPATSSQWTASDVNAMQVGVEIVS